MTLSVLFARNSLSAAASTISTLTGSAWIRAHSCSTPDAFDSHFVVQPNARVSATGTGLPARTASSALRASWVLTSSSRWLSSMRPWYRSLRCSSKMKMCGVATAPNFIDTPWVSPS